MATVYLLHFNQPLGNPDSPRGQARHYLGWAPVLASRLEAHLRGQGAAITRAARERGISWEVVSTWEGDYTLERRLKALHAGPRLCPICGRRHPAGPLRVVLHYHQLTLPLEGEADLPLMGEKPQPMDRYEYLNWLQQRRWQGTPPAGEPLNDWTMPW